mmetsp:Transcript_30786/g.57977  ORF Transcript_30786/g.57977 Transcript_30786/m.57977 type:complete len:99 (+) Transcript_30786:908-1204(+)
MISFAGKFAIDWCFQEEVEVQPDVVTVALPMVETQHKTLMLVTSSTCQLGKQCVLGAFERSLLIEFETDFYFQAFVVVWVFLLGNWVYQDRVHVYRPS